MKPVTLPTELEAALTQFKRGGGVVDYFVFEADTDSDLHLRATLEAFERLKPDLEPFKLTLEPALMHNNPVSLETFQGVMRGLTEVFDSPSKYLNARMKALADKGSFSLPKSDGYLWAFCEPPYSLQLAPEEAQRIFDTINAHLFTGFADDLEIRRWSDDWSNYFLAGLEWWGAFWWTVYNRTKGQIIVVAASETD